MPAFETLIPETLSFLDQLAANNNRDWFELHKSDYEAVIKRPAKALLDEIAQMLRREAGLTVTPKLYRVHRDLRFSRDKTPFNTHLHLQWTDRAAPIAFVFGASQSYVSLGVGAMAFDKPAMLRWRDHVASDAGAALAATIDTALAAGHRMNAAGLKRVPAPHDPDHPRADLLRRKGMVLWHDLDAAEQADPLTALTTGFARLEPFRKGLTAAISP
jgi:uncharacterized protein (TIGR02453 family)